MQSPRRNLVKSVLFLVLQLHRCVIFSFIVLCLCIYCQLLLIKAHAIKGLNWVSTVFLFLIFLFETYEQMGRFPPPLLDSLSGPSCSPLHQNESSIKINIYIFISFYIELGFCLKKREKGIAFYSRL